jgi:hypothetical protein
MNAKRRWVLALLASAALSGPAFAAGTLDDGHRLAAFLDSLGVESKWPAGIHVDWETGLPDGKTESFEGKHTHCSAFVASAAKQLGVYILRPPEHGQILLANAQFEWLASSGASKGWFAVIDGYDAQRYANRGYLVVASYENHDPKKPGHIAIVRPSGKSKADILAEGPQIIQAGLQNYQSTTVKHGFADHPTAFAGGEIRYWGHALP